MPSSPVRWAGTAATACSPRHAGGHVFWSFNDSFYGVVDGKTRARGSCSFPRNSLMIQKGATIASGQESDDDLVWLADYVQTDNPSGERYYQARTHIRHPKASLSDAEIQKGEIDQDYCYWAGRCRRI